VKASTFGRISLKSFDIAIIRFLGVNSPALPSIHAIHPCHSSMPLAKLLLREIFPGEKIRFSQEMSWWY